MPESKNRENPADRRPDGDGDRDGNSGRHGRDGDRHSSEILPDREPQNPTEASRMMAEAARHAAEPAREAAAAARINSDVARRLALLAERGADSADLSGAPARAAAELARDESEAARDAAEEARNRSEGARSVAEASRNLTESELKARDAFLAEAAHELRQPINSLHLALDLIVLGLSKAPVDEGMRERANFAGRQARRLNALVGDMMDVSHMSVGRFRLNRERCDLSHAAADAVASFADETAAKGIDLGLSAPAPVMGDWDAPRMVQVVINLIANAVRYGLGRPIRVAVSDGAGGASLTVRDAGIGIAAGDQERLFHRFHRASVDPAHRGGLGLGLYIVKQIVTAHGGTVSLESAPGQGSCFTVNLPPAAVPAV